MFLLKKKQSSEAELLIAQKVDQYIHSETEEIRSLKEISSSQWGAIRSIASIESDMNVLHQKLLDEESGYLTHGVANLKHWSKNKGKNLRYFSSIFIGNRKLGPAFIEKFAAEMAKISTHKE